MSKETVLITGASAGIGKELAHLFAADAANVVLVARRREKLVELAHDMRRLYPARVRVWDADLADPDVPQQLHDRAEAEGVAVDVLVNNAGFGALSPFARLPVDRALDMLRVNVLALTHLTRLFLPPMISRGQGGVLNVASTAAFQAGPNMAVYYASKSYILHFTEAIAEELRGTGVHASCLCPGPTITEFQDVAGMTDSPIFRLGPMSAGDVARLGYRGFRRGKTVVIAGRRNWLGAFAVRFAPRRFVCRVVHGLNRVATGPARSEAVTPEAAPCDVES